ncbi:hypothetical protein [Cytophaga aurantiaca]|uniref:hypothetical protein n=1 Tax=Cytophaga aurantiaca TaxID=29530 RepID=UPI00035E4956|nr:hypothetical protein [Cytophaga aurantiaca]
MYTYIKNILVVICILVAGLSDVAAQNDTCNVQSYVRADGVLIRGVDFEPIFKNDSIQISAAMYTIDKDYYLVLRIEGDKKLYKYNNDLAIQFSDSTVILLPFDSNKDDRSKKMYESYFKINNDGMGYIERYTVERFIYTVNGVRKNLMIQRKHILQRHFACLRKN